MGKAYAPVLADLFMGRWEEDLLDRAVEAGGAAAARHGKCKEWGPAESKKRII